MPSIFISYRRDDNPYAAQSICDSLKTTFGPDAVFFDVDNIPIGRDFRMHLSAAIAKCETMLVIIGDNWLARDSSGKTRLESPTDYVRIEMEEALNRNLSVVPVLVGRATVPRPEELPIQLQEFAYRQATEVRAGPEFRSQLKRLVQGIRNSQKRRPSLLASRRPKPDPKLLPDAEQIPERVSVQRGQASFPVQAFAGVIARFSRVLLKLAWLSSSYVVLVTLKLQRHEPDLTLFVAFLQAGIGFWILGYRLRPKSSFLWAFSSLFLGTCIPSTIAFGLLFDRLYNDGVLGVLLGGPISFVVGVYLVRRSMSQPLAPGELPREA